LVISRKKLVEASRQHGELDVALDAWYRITKLARWANINDVRLVLSTTDAVGECTVFNIKGNKCRLITWINYETHKVFIRHVLTHAEYDQGAWKNDCYGA
jgi:mRNA interferase HigB